MSPGRVEEFIFFDHPSGRNRTYAAMRWKAENLNLIMAEPVSAAAATTTQTADTSKR